MRTHWHEDTAATLIGLVIVAVALAVTWTARPANEPASRAAHPKGWPTPLSSTIDKPQTWADSPLEALRDKKGRSVAVPVVLGMGWVVLVGMAGALLGGRSVRGSLPGTVVLAAVACTAYLLGAQKVIHYYNLEYPLWALAVGLVIGYLVGVPAWLGRALAGEFLIKTGLSLFFTVLMMVAMPPLIAWMGLDPIVGVAWIGGTIDATGAVVAAGESLGKEAGEVAATVKMIQNSMIGVIAFAVAVYWAGWVDHDRHHREGSLTAEAWLFCAGFVCMGLQTNFRELAPALGSGRPLVLYVGGQLLNLALTLGMASLTFGWLFRKVVEP